MLLLNSLLSGAALQAKSGMDIYPRQQEVADPKQAPPPPPPQPPSTEDSAPPYSVNMSLLLPDAPYLHPGLCRAVRGVKMGVAHQPLPHGPGQGDYPPGLVAGDGNFLIKQEVSDFPDVPLFQLLNSDLEHLVHGPQPPSVLGPPAAAAGGGHLLAAPKASQRYQLTGHQQRPQPLPTSAPCSPHSSGPGGGLEQPSPDLTPPPSYEASIASKLQFHIHKRADQGQTCTAAPGQGPPVGFIQLSGRPTLTPVQAAAMQAGPRSPVLAQSAPFRSNRKHNPDLERRRVHHCDVPGEWRLCCEGPAGRSCGSFFICCLSCRLQKSLHQVVPLKSPSEDPHR